MFDPPPSFANGADGRCDLLRVLVLGRGTIVSFGIMCQEPAGLVKSEDSLLIKKVTQPALR